jgi:SAM-dependent methyltransferase
VNAYMGRTRGIAKQMAWDAARRVGLDLFDISLRIPSGHRVLDIGCGYGDLLIYYKGCGVSCVGVDFSELAVAKAREYGLDVRLGSLHTQKFQDSEFNAIIMCHSFEHIPYPLQTTAEIRRILKPGGVVQIAVPNAESPHFGQAWEHLSFPLHLYHFTTATLLRCLDGFSEVTTRVRRRTDALRVSAKL